MLECCENSDQREQAGAEIGEREARLHRPSSRLAGNRHDAGDALRHQVGAEIGQQHRTEWTGHHLRHIEHVQAGKRTVIHAVLCTRRRKALSTTHTTYEIHDSLAVLTFNRPQAHNAMTWAMYDALVG